jgi:hypothetical protein
MTTTRNRIERLETEMRFRTWVRHKRFRESLAINDLEMWAATGKRPERPEPTPGMSPIDNMEREQLVKMWKEDQNKFAWRNCAELAYFTLHGHWAEQACKTRCPKEQK